MFQCQSGYTLRKIKDTCYLLPYGQQIADQRKGMVLNETGTLLWNLLQHNEGMEFDDLISAIARIYHLDSDSIPMLCDDVRDFLTQLQTNGILVEDLHPISNFTTIYLEIAGLKLQIYDPKQLLLEQSALTHFDSFGFEPDSFPNAKADQRFELLTIPPASHAYGEVLLQNSELSVFEHTNHYIIVFHPMQNLYEAHMTKDGSYVRIYCKPEHSDTAAENLFHAIRLFFLFLAQKNGLFAIHSASLLYH